MPEEATAKDWEDFWHSEDGDDIVVNMDGGVGGSWQVKQKHFAGNYQGPLYARHPDLVNKDQELDKSSETYVDSAVEGGVICKRESPLSD